MKIKQKKSLKRDGYWSDVYLHMHEIKTERFAQDGKAYSVSEKDGL